MTHTAQAGPAVGNPAYVHREDAIGTPPKRPTLVPAARYYSAAFAQLEVERMWPKVWQVACTVDHVAEPGDYFEYRCGPYSVLIVRGDDGTLRAFQNVCRHRGNSLCAGSGSELRELKCGYHGWTWDLAGTLSECPTARGSARSRCPSFPLIARARRHVGAARLRQPRHSTRSRCSDFLEAVPNDIAWCGLGDFRCYATITVEVDANWKTIADGFSETYHIQTLHPELHRCMDDVYAPQVIWGLTGKSEQVYGVPSPHDQGGALRRRCVGRLCHHAGCADGRRGGHPVPRRRATAGSVGVRCDRRADKGFRHAARRRPELGEHRPDHATASVQRLPEHVASGQRRSPDGVDRTPGTRPRPRRTGDDPVDADAAGRAADEAGRYALDGRRGAPGPGADVRTSPCSPAFSAVCISPGSPT